MHVGAQIPPPLPCPHGSSGSTPSHITHCATTIGRHWQPACADMPPARGLARPVLALALLGGCCGTPVAPGPLVVMSPLVPQWGWRCGGFGWGPRGLACR